MTDLGLEKAYVKRVLTTAVVVWEAVPGLGALLAAPGLFTV